jgi:superfamily II DNA or RNA helicase
MTERKKTDGGELFIVDNSDSEWTVLQYLKEWCEIARAFDIAAGFFEIGSLLALDGEWQKPAKIRILMGDEVSRRTQQALLAGVREIQGILDRSIEQEKEKNDFLTGVPAIVEALRQGTIECRVYRKNKFHAKAYITHAKHTVIGPAALVGSSNFTYPGLTANVELNVQLRREVAQLQEWYERHWQEAEDVTRDVLRVIERHIAEYRPFDVYAKALHEFFRGHEMTASEWETTRSKMYPVLSQYQRQGYQTLMRIASQYNGAFLCDGVGLGKTFVGLMLIERLVLRDRKRVALFVPKAARADVWESHLERYLPDLKGKSYSNLAIFNHTDLSRGGEFPDEFRRIAEMADAVIVDEAHHFRNPGIKGETGRRPSRYRLLFDLLGGGQKQVFLLTATPINNKLDDFRHMAELFTRQQDDYFKNRLGIHSLRGHFVRLERELRKQLFPEAAAQTELPIELNEAEAALSADSIFRALVVQRSRAYVSESQRQEGDGEALFPEREPPRVIEYSVKKTYGRLLDSVERAFKKEKPLFILGIYYPLAYYKGTAEIDPLMENRQKQVVGLIRTQFLKRFESSALAFGLSCDRLLLRLLAWVTKHSETDAEKRRLDIWKRKHAELIGYVHQQQLELWGEEETEDAEEDVVPDEILDDVHQLSREEFRVEDILADSYEDMNQLVDFLSELRRFEPQHDDKLKALAELLKRDPILKREKVLVFSEFAETARYLRRELAGNGIEGTEEIDSMSKKNRSDIIRRFAPYYNGTTSAGLAADGESEIRVLISTDVLSEGLNLQDATRMINYDLHWNPVRLMQRIGRVDRRMNVDIEAMIVRDHPDQKALRGHVVFWNFLPPEDLDRLLRLYTKVSHKTLRISKTFGIEGKKLLRPEDDYEALKNFNHAYEGTVSAAEKMHLEYQQLLRDYPGVVAQLEALPGRVFSGKEHPSPGSKAVFFCYALPAVAPAAKPDESAEAQWSTELGTAAWYLVDLASGRIVEEPTDIVGIIRSTPETARVTTIAQKTLSEIRANVEKHIRNTHLKQVQAPVGVKPLLKAWMELG